MDEPPSKKARMENNHECDSDKKENGDQASASQDMFENSIEEGDESSGVPISQIQSLRNNYTLPSQYPSPHPGPGHTVCVQLPLTLGLPSPYPHTLRDVWDNHHVRLPWSKENLYPVEDVENKGKKVLRSRWDLIIEALTKNKITNSLDLEDAILTYNTRYRGKPDWSFSALHTLFTDEFEPEETEHFFNSTLPGMVDLIVSSPALLTSPIPLLSSGYSHSITLSQHQVSILLANAFFCTFPRRNAKAGGSEFASYPAVNFNTLYGACLRRPEAHMEKLKCLLSYFNRVVTNPPTQLITYSRKVVPARGVPNWANSSNTISKLHMASKGMIEVEGRGMLQADFANKYVGGGVLRSGLVQEEIRFTVCPELLASLLFTEVLGDREVLVVVGVEQFTEYEGYSDSFKFAGMFKDTVGLDSSGRKETSVVAMDAIRFLNCDDQFKMRNIDRELTKAFVGFQNRHVSSGTSHGRLQAVATGNWGCGAFGGDIRLKWLLQMMAAAVVGRDVLYLTFGDTSLVSEGGDMYSFLDREKVTVGELYRVLRVFWKSGRKLNGQELFTWIYQQVGSSREDGKALENVYEADTDSEKEDTAEKEEPKLNKEAQIALNETAGDKDLTDSDKWLNDQMDEIETSVQVVQNVGFFASLDKMEKGELESKNTEKVCPIEVSLGLSIKDDASSGTVVKVALDQGNDTTSAKQSEGATSKSNQSKVTDFFSLK